MNTMTKLTATVIALASLSSLPAAADELFFTGDIGSQKTTLEAQGSHDSDYDTYLSLGMGIRDVDSRTTLSLSRAGETSGGDKYRQANLLASYDKLYSLTEDNSVNFFAGMSAGLGYTHLKVEDAFNKTDYGFVYGAQTGLMMDIGEHSNIELGYRYLRHPGNNVKANGVGLGIRDTQAMYLGYTFKF